MDADITFQDSSPRDTHRMALCPRVRTAGPPSSRSRARPGGEAERPRAAATGWSKPSSPARRRRDRPDSLPEASRPSQTTRRLLESWGGLGPLPASSALEYGLVPLGPLWMGGPTSPIRLNRDPPLSPAAGVAAVPNSVSDQIAPQPPPVPTQNLPATYYLPCQSLQCSGTRPFLSLSLYF